MRIKPFRFGSNKSWVAQNKKVFLCCDGACVIVVDWGYMYIDLFQLLFNGIKTNPSTTTST